MIIKYRERIFIDRYKCIDVIKEINANRMFESGGLLYVYKDRYNIMTIAKEDVIEIGNRKDIKKCIEHI